MPERRTNIRRRCFFALPGALLAGIAAVYAMPSAIGQVTEESPPRLLTNQGLFEDADIAPLVPIIQPVNGEFTASLPGTAPVSPAASSVNVEDWVSPGGLTNTLKIMILMTVISLAPSILIMTTCFIRFVIVLGLLRQAIGTQQLPPNQVVIGLSLFLTFMVMSPVWQQAYDEGIRPYTAPEPSEQPLTAEEALQRTTQPLRQFMADQIEMAGNSDAVWMLIDFRAGAAGDSDSAELPENYDEVPLTVLVPAYMLSELKVAFLIGFQIYLPFVVVDMVISSILISMGMMMLPPVLISLPFKLLLFVLIDGWFLTIGMLLESVRPLTG